MASRTFRLSLVSLVGIAAIGLGWLAIATTAQGESDNPDDSDRVSHTEMEGAIQRALECFEANGVEPDPVEGEGQRLTMLGFRVPPEGGDPDNGPDPEKMEVVGECKEQHYADAMSGYLAQQGPPSDSELEAAADLLEQCVDQGGRPDVEVESFGVGNYAAERGIQPEITEDEFDSYMECAIAMEIETGMYIPAPKVSG